MAILLCPIPLSQSPTLPALQASLAPLAPPFSQLLLVCGYRRGFILNAAFSWLFSQLSCFGFPSYHLLLLVLAFLASCFRILANTFRPAQINGPGVRLMIPQHQPQPQPQPQPRPGEFARNGNVSRFLFALAMPCWGCAPSQTVKKAAKYV